MGTHVLMMNLRGSSWDLIPDVMWRNIVQRFAAVVCDAISFDTVAAAEDISRLEVFTDHAPVYIENASYRRIAIPFGVTDRETYQHAVAKFHFDEWIASLLIQQPINTWAAGNDGADADELVFWRGGTLKVQAVPYEGHIYFDNLSGDEKRHLTNADKRIESNLHAL